MTNEHRDVHIDVSTPDVATLALELQRIADRLEELSHRHMRSGGPLEILEELGEVRRTVAGLARDVRRAAEETARVGLSYLAHDLQAQEEFLRAWNDVSFARVNNATAMFGGEASGPLGVFGFAPVPGLTHLANVIVGPTLWAGTALAAAFAFTIPTSASVAGFRVMASNLGGYVEPHQTAAEEGPLSSSVASAGSTRALASGMTALTSSGKSIAAVTATRLTSETCSPPGGFADLVGRIPRAEPGGAQVRIDRIGSTAIVYIGGTVSESLSGGGEPWDMGSNIAALGGTTSDSERGARDAMRRAGVTDAPRIILVGHSQGALVAQRLAADTALRVTDVVTVGAPIQPSGIPARVRVTTIENANDPIPALGGVPGLDARDVSVRRTEEIRIRGDALAAHHIGAYRETADAMDRSRDPLLVQTRRDITSGLSGDCLSSSWRSQRAP